MIDSSYDTEITYNKILGDMEIVDMCNKIKNDFKCAKKRYEDGYISRLEYEIFTEIITKFMIEFIYIRMNEYDKWFEN